MEKKRWMPAMYVTYFGIIEKIVKKHGYALCVHGSVVRDFDLIAIPFEDKISSHEDVLSDIREMVGLSKTEPKYNIVGHEPHGRTCYTIECGGGGYFDISFTPTLQDAIREIKRKEEQKSDMQKLLEKPIL